MSDDDVETPEPAEPAQKQQPVVLSPRTRVVIAVLLMVAGIVVGALSQKDLRREYALHNANKLISATVSDTTINTSAKGPSTYDVHYHFDVDGKTYTYTDATGRRNLYASMKHGAWEVVRKSGRVDVLYDPDDPWINRPKNVRATNLLDMLAGA